MLALEVGLHRVVSGFAILGDAAAVRCGEHLFQPRSLEVFRVARRARLLPATTLLSSFFALIRYIVRSRIARDDYSVAMR